MARMNHIAKSFHIGFIIQTTLGFLHLDSFREYSERATAMKLYNLKYSTFSLGHLFATIIRIATPVTSYVVVRLFINNVLPWSAEYIWINYNLNFLFICIPKPPRVSFLHLFKVV